MPDRKKLRVLSIDGGGMRGIIPAMVLAEIERRMPFFFRSRRARERTDYDYAVRDVARAASAAPTYFEPHRIVADGNPLDHYALIDGGVFANNPAMCAYVEAKAADPRADFLLVSLGTGELVRDLQPA